MVISDKLALQEQSAFMTVIHQVITMCTNQKKSQFNIKKVSYNYLNISMFFCCCLKFESIKLCICMKARICPMSFCQFFHYYYFLVTLVSELFSDLHSLATSRNIYIHSDTFTLICLSAILHQKFFTFSCDQVL